MLYISDEEKSLECLLAARHRRRTAALSMDWSGGRGATGSTRFRTQKPLILLTEEVRYGIVILGLSETPAIKMDKTMSRGRDL